MPRYYKFLGRFGRAVRGGHGIWSLPTDDGPGEWMPEIADPMPCRRGYHASTLEHLLHWNGPALFEVEYDGPLLYQYDKVVGGKARLVRRIKAWNHKTVDAIAAEVCLACIRAMRLDQTGRDAAMKLYRQALATPRGEPWADYQQRTRPLESPYLTDVDGGWVLRNMILALGETRRTTSAHGRYGWPEYARLLQDMHRRLTLARPKSRLIRAAHETVLLKHLGITHE